MGLPFSTSLIREGAALIKTPAVETWPETSLERAIYKAPVFYNPRMKLNRDSAVIVLKAHQRISSKSLRVCEPMCGTGVRGIRLALEVEGLEGAVLGDINPLAVRLAEINADLNNVSDRVRVRLIEANLLLALHASRTQRFDYIDIDPYGSPVPYIESALRACRVGGIIALTATDMAPLCGVNPRACLRRYGGWPLRTEYSKELALRLLISSLVHAAARLEMSINPIFSFSIDHYLRVYALVGRGARGADSSLAEVGYILHCSRCLNRRVVRQSQWGVEDMCEVCGGKMKVGGPLWTGKLADPAFSSVMASISEEEALGEPRLVRLVNLVKGEIELPPFFFNVDLHCSRLGVRSQPTEKILTSLKDAGFRAARTHFDWRGIKSDASTLEFESVLKESAGRG
ncbi:MAG: tRNA (guanine(10)-N(2))-dimethyltransferase [Candidatus Bathyarchaeia archaeon]